ncbi:MAG: MMPL family transporter [Myxococcota bacterium]
MSAAERGTPRTRRLAVFIERRAGLVVLLTVVFAIVAGLGASNLRIDQRLRKLLPDHFPSVAGMDRVAERLGNQSNIYVSIASPSGEANVGFGDALATELEGHPDLRWSLFRRDDTFFERHALFYASIDDLLDLRRRVIERIFEETRTAAYGDLSLLDEEPAPNASEGPGSDPGPAPGPDSGNADDPDPTALGLDEDELRRRYGLDEGRSEFFEADEGRLLVLKARPIHESTDLDFARRLQADLEQKIATLDPARFHPHMKVGLHGSFVQHGQRVKQLQGDVIGGTAAAIAALLLSIAIYFRSARAVLLVLGPLLVAGVGALGFAWLVYDVLNLVSAFIFAVLLGLGIDFAVHVLARYRDERARGHRRPTAIAITLATTGRSTLAGGVGTGLAFCALTIADFQGFAQFGVVASFGLVLAMLAALVVMPAALVLSERWRPWAPPPPRTSSARSSHRLGRPVMIGVTMLAVGGAAVALYAGLHARDLEFEYDFRAMGPRKAQAAEKAAERQITYRDAIGRAQTVAPAIALTEDRAQAESLYRQLTVLRLMTPEEAEALTPIAASREPSLADVVSPQGMDKPSVGSTPDEPPPGEPAQPAVASPTVAGDDWDADPEDWVDPTRADDDWADPTRADDDWDADPEDWADPADNRADDRADDRAARPRAPGIDDPRFTAIAQAERARTLPDALTQQTLHTYEPARRIDMADRLRAVTSIDAFIPTGQAAKLEIIADIRARIDDKRDAMSSATQEEIDAWYDKLTLTEPIDVGDLPPWVQQQFTDARGEVGRFVVIRTGGSKADYLNSRRIYDAFATLHTPSGEIPVAAEFFVLPEVFEAIEADGPRVLLLAGLAMLLTAAVAFRGAAGVAAVSLVVGSTLLWLVALMLALGWKLNFFNVIVLPLLIGMAQDDALHIYERWREAGRAQLGMVLRETGGAVFLTTLTTVCGFAGILFANHRGLQSMAWAAVCGMTLALIASVVLLPATLWVAEGLFSRRDRSPGQADET